MTMLLPVKEKIALFVCDDLTGMLIMNSVVPGLKNLGYEPVIFNTGLNRNRAFKIPTPPVVAFFNATLPSQVIVPTLEGQPITDAPNHTYRQLAAIHGVTYREIDDVNNPDFVNEIISDSYRGGIAIRFLQVFGPEAISVFHEKGFLWNLHSGLLPDYKGLLTPYRAIANGEKTYGLTLHDLTCGIDRGAIIAKGELPLDPKRPVLDLYLDSVPTAARLVLENAAIFKCDGSVQLMPQEKKAGAYYTNPTSAEFRKFATDGIIYAHAEAAVERISGLFSAPETILHARLKQNMSSALQSPNTREAILFPTQPQLHAAMR